MSTDGNSPVTNGESEWDRQQEHRATERELQAHFAGRRGALRTEKSHQCHVVGPHGKFRAVVVDLSRSGALIKIVDNRFASGEDREQLMLYTARVWHHFPEGLELQVESRNICAVATIVRVKCKSGETGGPYELGIHFRTELTEEECDRLGIEWADDRDDSTEMGNSVADAFDRILTSLTPDTDDDNLL